MKSLLKSTLSAAVLSLVSTAAFAESANPDAQLLRGRYLVEKVGMCADCHSPRNERGEFIRERWLGGSPLAFAPSVPMPVWAPVAPPIAGLPSMSVEGAARFLQTGVRPDGSSPRPPMPEFRFSEADATAVATYLKSLAP